MIEARIVTITDESLKELGVRWGIFNPNEPAGVTVVAKFTFKLLLIF